MASMAAAAAGASAPGGGCVAGAGVTNTLRERGGRAGVCGGVGATYMRGACGAGVEGTLAPTPCTK